MNKQRQKRKCSYTMLFSETQMLLPSSWSLTSEISKKSWSWLHRWREYVLRLWNLFLFFNFSEKQGWTLGWHLGNDFFVSMFFFYSLDNQELNWGQERMSQRRLQASVITNLNHITVFFRGFSQVIDIPKHLSVNFRFIWANLHQFFLYFLLISWNLLQRIYTLCFSLF